MCFALVKGFVSHFAKWDHPHPSPLPSEREGTGRPALAASGDGFRLSAAGMIRLRRTGSPRVAESGGLGWGL